MSRFLRGLVVVSSLYGWCDAILVLNAWICRWICCLAGARDCCRKTVARPANLAQASQSRLGEMSRGSPKPYYARGRLGDPLIIFERASISSKREGSRLSKILCGFPDALSSPRLGEGGLAWARTSRLSETLQPERGAGRGSTLFGCLFVLGWLVFVWVWVLWWETCI